MKNRGLLYVAMAAFSLSGLTAMADTDQIKDPMAYAEKNSKSFAEGDSNDPSGWEGCEYLESDSGSGSARTIQCGGTRDILIFGGHMVTSEFSCAYDFELNADLKTYSVSSEDCQ